MAKPKKSASRGGAVKKHGPKRKMFHCYNKAIRIELGRLGLLSKYHNFESFTLACQARGVKAVTDKMWYEFCLLPIMQAKKEWFKALKK